MAKDNLYQYDSTAANNLDVGGISVAEGMLPSGVNNAIRELMSHQKDFVTGAYLAGTGNVALGDAALDDASLSGNYNTAVGNVAMTANTTGEQSVGIGHNSLGGNTTGNYNVAAGFAALYTNNGSNNTAIGHEAAYLNSTGNYNTAVGKSALRSNTTGASNTAMGAYDVGGGYGAALQTNTTGSYNAAYGVGALQGNSTGSYNTALGTHALLANTTASSNTAVGYQSVYNNTTGTFNTAVGISSLNSNTTASYNVAIGPYALYDNTTASGTTAIGYAAGYSQNRTGSAFNTFLGMQSGYSVTTGTKNTFVGGINSGYGMTTGSSNTIIGNYTGNQGGLDIRTSDNYIVLSDGVGNPRMRMNGSGLYCPEVYSVTGAASANVYVDSSGNLYRATSSLKYKTDIQDAEHGLAELLQLRSVTYKSKKESETNVTFGGLIAEEVHDAGLTEFVQYAPDGTPDALAYGNMVSLCIKAIQEQQATITALEARVAALES